MKAEPQIKAVILSEIRRLHSTLGKSPGVAIFTRETGIPQHQWYEVIWSRWSDALQEAGLAGNALQSRFNSGDVLRKVANAALDLGHIPTTPEMKILRRQDEDFPNPKTVAAHFGPRGELIEALRDFCAKHDEYAAVVAMLPATAPKIRRTAKGSADGWVYLLKSGAHFKIGRSDALERRVKAISIALPEAVVLVHAISTDDPVGIEAYWHRRFADRRLNGEWFKLDDPDVAAFRRRKFQ